MSFGSRYASVITGRRKPIRAAVLLSGGFPPERYLSSPSALYFAPRVRIPVLMLNTPDFLFRWHIADPLFDRSARRRCSKQHVLLTAYGHYLPARRLGGNRSSICTTLIWVR